MFYLYFYLCTSFYLQVVFKTDFKSSISFLSCSSLSNVYYEDTEANRNNYITNLILNDINLKQYFCIIFH